jgi:hypothetical protein
MSLSGRLVILCLVAVLFLATYAVGRYYSPMLVYYVVTEALIEKAPAGTDPAWLRSRISALRPVSSSDNRKRLNRLLVISQRIERVQKLTPSELEDLLGPDTRQP